MNKRLAAALFAAASLAAGCSGGLRSANEKNPAPCPNIVVLSDAARIIDFDGEERADDVAFTGEITNAAISCRYIEDRPIRAEVDLAMAFGRGPKASTKGKNFSYFVAIARRDLEVIAKEEFVVPVEFGGDEIVVTKVEQIDQIVIPRKGENVSGVNFEIIVGFSLTPEQAIFNRSGKSLKFPNLQ